MNRILSIAIPVLLAAAAGPSTPPGQASTTQAHFAYLSPLPGARFVRPESGLIFRTREDVAADERWTGSCVVRGSKSGVHAGQWVQSDDDATIIFQPSRDFSPGETVTVSVAPEPGKTFRYAFEVSGTPAQRSASHPLRCLETDHASATKRSVDPPDRTPSSIPTPPGFPHAVVTHSDVPENGSIFLTNMAFSDTLETSFHLIILDNTGEPVFFRKTWNSAVDFKKQPNGLLTYFVLGNEKFHALDSTYTVVDSFAAGNGYTADFHDMQILPNGHALLMIYDPQPVDMSQVVPGGNPNAIVEGLVIQELDANKNVVFQWRSWDHFSITDANIDLTTVRVDYVHGNSLEPDTDGNILLSSRHLDEITKINRSTGAVMWRMGGNQNEFTILGDTLWFSRQHDVRRLANGNISMFDNGNVKRRSRSIEYFVDENNKTLTSVWEYRNTPDAWGWAMGSSQRLLGGNTLVGWGSANPTLTEVRPDGTKALEITFPNGVYSYRAYRHTWSGNAAVPYLWAETSAQSVTLAFDKFGDATVQQYYIYQGETPNPTAMVDSTADNSIDLTGLTPGVPYYFRVKARGGAGISTYSNEVSATIELTTPVVTTVPQPSSSLGQNYPNPFNPTTVIPYRIETTSHINLAIYSVTGSLIRTLVDDVRPPGDYRPEWDGRDQGRTPVSSGVYFYRLRTANATLSRAMTLLK